MNHIEGRGRLEPSMSFGDLTVSGNGIVDKPDQHYGPVLFNQYTLSRNSLKYTAQLAPMGKMDDQKVSFHVAIQ